MDQASSSRAAPQAPLILPLAPALPIPVLVRKRRIRRALQALAILIEILAVTGAMSVVGALAVADGTKNSPWDRLWLLGSPALIIFLSLSVFELLILQVGYLPYLPYLRFEIVKLVIITVDTVVIGIAGSLNFYFGPDVPAPRDWFPRTICGWLLLCLISLLGSLHSYAVWREAVTETDGKSQVTTAINDPAMGPAQSPHEGEPLLGSEHTD